MVDGVGQGFCVVRGGGGRTGRTKRKALFVHPALYGGLEVFGEIRKKRQQMAVESVHGGLGGGEFVKNEQDLGGDGLKRFVVKERMIGVLGGVAESDHKEQEVFELGGEEAGQKRRWAPSPFFEQQRSCLPKAPTQGSDGDLKPLLKKGGEGFGRRKQGRGERVKVLLPPIHPDKAAKR